jgi:Heparinase II/III-like protein
MAAATQSSPTESADSLAPVRRAITEAPGIRGLFRGPLAAAWGAAAGSASLARSLLDAPGRMTVRPATERRLWDAVAPAAIATIAEEASAEKGSPWPQPLVSHYARYFRDGNRTAYEGLVGARQQRLTRAVVMACLSATEQPRLPEPESGPGWLDEVIDGAYLLCEQSSWSWAAHDDVSDRRGHVVPDRRSPYLDLGAGEVAAQLAWLDHVLGAELDRYAPGLRERVRNEVLERVIRPFLDRDDWHWLGLSGHVHNWNPWIHSNVLAAAIFLIDDPRLRADTVALAIEGLDRFMASIPGDGAIDEGFAYWWNGAGRAMEALALLDEATGGALHGDLPVVRELLAFPHRMHLGHQWFLNVADGPARAAAHLPWDMVHRWAVRLGDVDAARLAESLMPAGPDAAGGLGRTLHALAAPAGDSPTPATPPLPGLTYLDSVQIMVARESPGSMAGLVLAAKGGHNGENHNHRDVGSVVVAVDGVPLLVDAGQPTYTAQTFGPDRYNIRAMQSGWHSVPAPFGQEQRTGAEFAARVERTPSPGNPLLALELSGAYGLGLGSSWTRTAALDRGNARAVIEDRWALTPAAPAASPDTAPPDTAPPAHPETLDSPDVDIHYLLAGSVHLGPLGAATAHPEGIPSASGPAGSAPAGRGARLRWNPAVVGVQVDEWTLDDPLLSSVWGARLTRLRFRMPAELRTSGTFTLTVEARP